MIKKFIKKDINEELEDVLEKKNIDENVKNLLQDILYKIEVSYKDYQKVKTKEKSEKQYLGEIISNIQKKCNQIKIIEFSQRVNIEKIQKSLEKKKYYVDDRKIITYPIEEKLLYAIEKKINNNKIVNAKYEKLVIPLSDMINTGKCIDRIEVLRDFNGWSWTTINSEIENIKANLFYQTLQILLGEDFMENWTKDKDGIIDYYKMLKEEISDKYINEVKNISKLEQLILQIAIISESEENEDYKMQTMQNLRDLDKRMKKCVNVQDYVQEFTEDKKKAALEIKEIEKILTQEARVKAEYKKRNEENTLDEKIISIKAFKQQMMERKKQLLEQIEKDNYYLNPNNYLEAKKQMENEKKLLELIYYTDDEKEKILIEFEKIFLKCFKKKIQQSKAEDIIDLIYKFRYYMLLPFNSEKKIKDIEELQKEILDIEKLLTKLAKKEKVISNEVPFEAVKHVFKTRIIDLENLYYKISVEYDKKYIQIFDENVKEEKFEIDFSDKNKINKKVKIFI